ncbi:serine hydrolase domain-containing protein [Bradyrhizobium sp. 2TAF24]|uniref:serine hydrolase domain-containing protein n=1 Tax=Bradyrhizobium sp. 2TAF24 TaxID=3233011 RepID=UPI003F93D4D8
MRFDRRTFLGSMALGATATVTDASRHRVAAAPAAADFEQRLAMVAEHDKLSGLHAVLVSQHGRIIFEHYQPGTDVDRRGRNLGTVAFAPDVPHDLRSVTKGVVGLLYGIALADGKVPPPDARLYDQFPQYADLAAEPGRDRITIAHVLSMTLGLQWDELTIPYGDPRNSENAMDDAPDRYRYILSLPIAAEPGRAWLYCGGATALLGHLIARGTGMPLLDYAQRMLFGPMDFGPVVWGPGRDGEPIAASGLRLLPRDMLKVGQLVLARGNWQGRQLVPEAWVRTVTTQTVTIDQRRSYGYHWYMGDIAVSGQPHHWIGGIGWGGQRLFVMPDLDLVVGINCGNYDKPGSEQSRVALTVLIGAVLPLVT